MQLSLHPLLSTFGWLSLLFLALGTAGCSSSSSSSVASLSPTEIEARIDSLLTQMTLAEKVGQMNQYSSSWDITGPATGDNQAKRELLISGQVGSMLNVTSVEATREAQRLAVEETRLGIPLIFGYDVIHGYKTMFPIPLAEVASWDLDLMEQSAAIAAKEASASGIHWTFAPMVDIARDARWGRVMEGAGEDPYLGSRVATARVRGFQGSSLADLRSIAACAKHFAAYGYATGGRDYNTVDIGQSTLHDVVFPPFKAALDAGVATFMNAFNEVDGIPSTGNRYLQRDILKGEWGFQGFVVSDWGSIEEMRTHGYARDERHAALLAAQAGSDMDMESYCYVPHLVELVEAGEVDEALVDDAVRRILRIKFQLGLFDDPYRYCDPEREQSELYTDEHLALARQAAAQSAVLLKNEQNLLPLDADELGSIAVIGPLADDQDSPLGSWRAQADSGSAVSLLEGIRARVGDAVEIRYAQGVPLAVGQRTFIREVMINETDSSGFEAAVEAARGADVVVMALGEDCWQSGEARSRTEIDLPGLQLPLLRRIQAVNPNIVLVLMNGRPLALTEVEPLVPAILEGWFGGSQAGHGLADVLFGAVNPAGKLPMTFPRAVGQVPMTYAHKSTGRPFDPDGLVFWSHYIDESNLPLYPFGYGLSYTEFAYRDLKVSQPSFSPGETLEVSVTVTNRGDRAGQEVVQLYVHDKVGSRTRPVKELKGFEKISLSAGQSRRVTFELTAGDLAFYTAEGKYEPEPGEFGVFVGGSSRDEDLLKGAFELTQE